MKAEGKLAWWNQYGHLSIDEVVDRAKDGGISTVIVKAGYPSVQDKFMRAGIAVGTEAYVYPSRPEWEGERLAQAVQDGAQFAVINAEVEWEDQNRTPMLTLIEAFRHRKPSTELYASTDTRGNRTHLPYQRVLSENIVGWMPMIYPLAFYPRRPAGYVSLAFKDCLELGQQFDGLPVLPTIQTYNGIGEASVAQQIAECRYRHCKGYQAYTIGHATDEEWSAFKESELVEEGDVKVLVWAGGYMYAQRWGHYWYIQGQDVVDGYLTRGWLGPVNQDPTGTRIDF